MKPRICIFHQSLTHSFGGAASVCAWILEALKSEFRVFLATPDEKVAPEELNLLYGTELSSGDFEFIPLMRSHHVGRLAAGKFKSVRLALAVREFASMGGAFDLVVNTVNEVVFPFPSLQYIHCPIRSYKVLSYLYRPPELWYRAVNNTLFRLVSRTSRGPFAKHTNFIANSEWTAEKFSEAYGYPAHVVYPPVKLTESALRHPPAREQGFVAVGRLAPDKRMHEAVEIIDIVRRKVQDIHLHVVGHGEGKYARDFQRMVGRRPYVFLHKDISRIDLSNLLRSHTCGIHPTRNEHFGMAPAEMSASGALVFVHNSGGQVEIVDKAEELVFDSVKSGADKILKVLSDAAVRTTLKKRLERASTRFSLAGFRSSIAEFVRQRIAAIRGDEA